MSQHRRPQPGISHRAGARRSRVRARGGRSPRISLPAAGGRLQNGRRRQPARMREGPGTSSLLQHPDVLQLVSRPRGAATCLLRHWAGLLQHGSDALQQSADFLRRSSRSMRPARRDLRLMSGTGGLRSEVLQQPSRHSQLTPRVMLLNSAISRRASGVLQQASGGELQMSRVSQLASRVLQQALGVSQRASGRRLRGRGGGSSRGRREASRASRPAPRSRRRDEPGRLREADLGATRGPGRRPTGSLRAPARPRRCHRSGSLPP